MEMYFDKKEAPRNDSLFNEILFHPCNDHTRKYYHVFLAALHPTLSTSRADVDVLTVATQTNLCIGVNK